MTRLQAATVHILCCTGLILSLLSATDLCSFGGCTEAHSYRLYGLPFPVVGTLFFVLCTLLFALRSRRAALQALDAAIAAAAGAEASFIYAQKYIIGAWCPLCLLIALNVAALAGARTWQALRYGPKGENMAKHLLMKTTLLAALSLAGFFGSLTGLGKTEATAAPLDISLGKTGSPVEVYIFTDWYCGACEKVEPVLLFTFPQLAQRARVFFMDKNIHRDSANFVPYNLSFLVHEKAKYPALRRTLAEVAHRTKNPTPDEVQKAVAPLGVTFRPLSFADITQAVAESETKIREFKVNATPTMVIRNTKSGKTKVLSSTGDLTSPKILKALQEVEQ